MQMTVWSNFKISGKKKKKYLILLRSLSSTFFFLSSHAFSSLLLSEPLLLFSCVFFSVPPWVYVFSSFSKTDPLPSYIFSFLFSLNLSGYYYYFLLFFLSGSEQLTNLWLILSVIISFKHFFFNIKMNLVSNEA